MNELQMTALEIPMMGNWTNWTYAGDPKFGRVDNGDKITLTIENNSADDRASWFSWWSGPLDAGLTFVVDYDAYDAGEIKLVYQLDSNAGPWRTITVDKKQFEHTIPANVYRLRLDGRYWFKAGKATFENITLALKGVIDPTEPPAPTTVQGLAAQIEPGPLPVQWQAVSDAAGYRLYRSIDSDVQQLLIDSTTALSWSDMILEDWRESFICYQVVTYNAAGETKSNVVCTAVNGLPIAKAVILPLPAVLYAPGQYALKWQAAANAESYMVMSSDAGGDWYALGATDADTFEFLIENDVIDAGTERCFRVDAIYQSGTAVGDPACVTIEQAPGPEQVVVVDFPTKSEAGAFTIFWNPAIGANEYAVHGKIDDGPWELLAYTDQLFYDTHHLLEEIGTIKCYRIDSINDAGMTAGVEHCTDVASKTLTIPDVIGEPTGYDVSGYLWDDKLFLIVDPNAPLMSIFNGAISPAPVTGQLRGREIELFVDNPDYPEYEAEDPPPEA